MNNKLTTKNLILGLIVVAVLATAGFLLWEKADDSRLVKLSEVVEVEGNQQNQGEQQIDEDYGHEIESIEDLIDTTEETNPLPKIDTTGWKTYRNEEMGFEVKIPQTWEVDDIYSIEDLGSMTVNFKKVREDKSTYKPEEWEGDLGDNYNWIYGVGSISYYKRNNPGGNTLLGYLLKRKEYGGENFYVEKINFGSYDAILYRNISGCSVEIEIFKDEKHWSIHNVDIGGLCEQGKGMQKVHKEFIGVFQSFKFLN